jgi:hypothetical protein
VLRFALPSGVVAAAATFVGYRLAREDAMVSLAEARTVATLVLFGVALVVLRILVRASGQRAQWLVPSMGVPFAIGICFAPLRRFFAVDLPAPVIVLAAGGIVALAAVALQSGWSAAEWLRRRLSAVASETIRH